MKAFIAGSYGPFSVALIERLAKEGWECYVLTGSGMKSARSFQKAMEEYPYEYDNEIVKNILESVNPDVVIFTGAADPVFDFLNIRKSAVSFLSGLTNLLISSRLNRVRHFIYLSSEQVFQGDYEERIKEETEAAAEDLIGRTILQGEQLCAGYAAGGDGMEITVLRLINLFGFPRKGIVGRDFYSDLCMRIIKGKIISYMPGHKFSCLYIPDAVEAVYRTMAASRRRHSLYQVASLDIIEEEEMIAAVKTLRKDATGFETANEDAMMRQVFSSERFRDEFGFQEKYHFDKVSGSIYKYFIKHSKELLTEREYHSTVKTGWRETLRKIRNALLPYLEALGVFLVITVISRAVSGNEALGSVEFFFLYVLLFGIIYGRKLSLACCLLSVAGKLWLLSGEAGLFGALTDLRTYLWVLVLFLIGMSVGHLKDALKKNLEERDEQIHYLNMEIDDLGSINESNMAIKKLYETRLVNYQDSLGKIYNITSKLDELEPGKVLINAALVLEQIMGTKDVAIYNVVNSDYCRLAIATSDKARKLGKSKKFKMWGELYESISKNEVYINRTLDEDLPMMAHAIFNQDSMEMILMIWGLDFEQLTLYQSNLLMILGKMMYESIHRAYKYMESINSQNYIEGTQIMEESAFLEIIENERYANEMGMSEFTILVIETQNMDLLEWYQKLKGMTRDSDTIGMLNDHQIGILLTNTAQGDSLTVRERFKRQGVDCRIGRGGRGL